MTTTPTECMLADAKEAAAICGMSRAAWYKHLSAGKIPRPVKIGSLTRWRRQELMDWIDAGCPNRQKWDTMTSGQKAAPSKIGKQGKI